ncbi:hypothetical protein HDU67_004833 [Dinochytrium kinnereticum]|nr:hypothetical protein HDU67_004833 [Dinochytrium kinnereticum]
MESEYSDLNAAARGAVLVADCVCGDVFGPRGTLFEFAKRCSKELLSVDEELSGSILNLLELMTGGVGNNINPARLAVGISQVPEACEVFSANEVTINPPPASIPGGGESPAGEPGEAGEPEPESPAANEVTARKRFTEEQVKLLSPHAVDVVSKLHLQFIVHGKKVVPLHRDAITSGAIRQSGHMPFIERWAVIILIVTCLALRSFEA